ncbi:MAG: dihydrolipoamide acetyltransferase family protein [Nannocystaceae bacterium]
MATVVELPRLSDTMEEGVVAKWLVRVGDDVKRGQVIAEIETDKATMEFESFDRGRVLKLLAEEGQMLPIGAPIAVLGKEGDDVDAVLQAADGGSTPATAASPAAATQPGQVSEPVSGTVGAASSPVTAERAPSEVWAREASLAPVEASAEPERVAASPAARKLARELGVELASISGTGPHGRVVRGDVEAAPARPHTAPAVALTAADVDEYGRPFVTRPSTTLGLTPMRRTIVRRMLESQQQAPHFYLTIEIDMERASTLRAEYNVAVRRTKVSYNDLLLLAAAKSLRENPRCNATYSEEGIVEHGDICVGFAVALDDGLIVPVVKYTDQKTLKQISVEVRDLGKRAKQKQLRPAEMTGSTFTVSNLGMFGISEFAAMVNPGEGAILAVGAVEAAPAVVDGSLVVRRRMRATLSCDHRVVDGAVGAQYLATLKALLEEPMRLFA